MKTQIEISAKLLKAQETAKEFFLDHYQERLKPYTRILNLVMKANKLEAIPALLKISETEHYKESPVVPVMYMAAVVEMIVAKESEPNKSDKQ